MRNSFWNERICKKLYEMTCDRGIIIFYKAHIFSPESTFWHSSASCHTHIIKIGASDLSARHLSELFSAHVTSAIWHLSDCRIQRFSMWAKAVFQRNQFQRPQYERLCTRAKYIVFLYSIFGTKREAYKLPKSRAEGEGVETPSLSVTPRRLARLHSNLVCA